MAIALSGCTAVTPESVVPNKSEEPAAEKKIALLLQHRTAKRYDGADIPAFEAACAEYGYTPVVQSAEDDSARQIAQAESVILQGVSAILLQPLNFEAGAQIVEIAAEAGIPVISYNDLVQNADIKGFVGRNSKKLGVDSAEMMTKLFPEGNYIIVSGDEGAGVARDMTEGFKEVLLSNPSIKIVSEQFNKGWAADSAIKQVEGALIANSDDIVAVLSNNDGMAVGALQALESAGIAGQVGLCGQDLELPAAQAIVAGKMSFTAFTEYAQMARNAVEMAVAIIEGKDLPNHTTINNGFGDIPWMETTVIYVTKDTMDDFLSTHSWWLTPEEVYATR